MRGVEVGEGADGGEGEEEGGEILERRTLEGLITALLFSWISG